MANQGSVVRASSLPARPRLFQRPNLFSGTQILQSVRHSGLSRILPKAAPATNQSGLIRVQLPRMQVHLGQGTGAKVRSQSPAIQRQWQYTQPPMTTWNESRPAAIDLKGWREDQTQDAQTWRQ